MFLHFLIIHTVRTGQWETKQSGATSSENQTPMGDVFVVAAKVGER